ncbi:MAG: 50S ribosomal protein L23 [Gammaproteobacteria bacterium]|nr:MAG: 50S ribosomal protein L23 [Gammaproteobacteria bacterium]
MNQERLMKVLVGAHITEKSTLAADAARQFVFKVLPNATKPEVKRAVEKLFEVEVERVQMVNVKGKSKRSGRTLGKRSDFNKAYVRLKPGHDINFAGAE